MDRMPSLCRMVVVVKIAATLAASALFGSISSYSREVQKSIPWDETGPFSHVDGSGEHRDSFEKLKHHRNQTSQGGKPSKNHYSRSWDAGDIAVIVDNGDIIIPERQDNPYDLPQSTSISFTPTLQGFDVHSGNQAIESSQGTILPLGDDDTIEIPLPEFSFPFLEVTYSSIWVNSDGNITLGAGDGATAFRDVARLISGPPRLAPYLADLDPTAGGSIFADVRIDRVVITWLLVPEFELFNSNTFQIILHSSGKIEFIYDRIDSPYGVIGLAEGTDEGPFTDLDLSNDLPGTFEAGAIFEEFAPSINSKQIDIFSLAHEFYKTHEDHFDFLVIFTDFSVDLGDGSFAFHTGVQNQTKGLGLLHTFDSSSLAGSKGELESILHMNRIGLYWPDAGKLVNPPIKKFRFFGGAKSNGAPGSKQLTQRARWFGTLQGDFGFHGSYTLGLNSAMSLMAQETGHRWLAFTPFIHPTKGFGDDSVDLLGRDLNHWNFFFNTRVPTEQFSGDPRASSAEGNAILDLGPNASLGLPLPCTQPGESTFLTELNELIDGYSRLDQYLMGLRTADEVGPFWYVDEPRSPFNGSSIEFAQTFDAQDDIVFCGKRVNLTIDHITQVPIFNTGPRIPVIGDEIDQDANGNNVPDVKTMAFILLIESGSPKVHRAAIQQVDIFRRTWQWYANGPATGGRGRFDTSLQPKVH